MLYTAPDWINALSKKVFMGKLPSIQRQLALRVTATYRTVSFDAVMVVALDLLANERCEIFEKSKAGDTTISQKKR